MRRRLGIIFLAAAGLYVATVAIFVLSRRPLPPAAEKPLEPPTAEIASSTPENPEPPAETTSDTQPSLLIEVADREGRAVEGARARIARYETSPVWSSDEAGHITIPWISIRDPVGKEFVRLRIEHDHFAPAVAHVRRGEDRLRVTLGDSATVVVEVVNEASMPVPDAEVRVDEVQWGHYGPKVRPWKTDEFGQVRLSGLPAGALAIRAVAAGYEEARTFIVAYDAEPRNVQLVVRQGRRVNVTVRSNTGQPVAEARVNLAYKGGGMSIGPEGYQTYHWIRSTNDRGVATFESLPRDMDKAWVRVKARQHPLQHKVIDLTGPATDVEFILEPGAALTVEALDTQGQSVACRVSVFGKGIEESYSESAKEKPAGSKVTFEGLPSLAVLGVSVSRYDATIYVEEGIVLNPLETRDLTIRLPVQFNIKVVVRDSHGHPVSGFVDLSRKKTGLDLSTGMTREYISYRCPVGDDGIAKLFVHDGTYAVKFYPDNGARIVSEVRVVGDMTVEVVVPSEAAISGVVVDPAGAPVSGVEVLWYEENASWRSVTGADGRFALNRLRNNPGKLLVCIGGVMMERYAGLPPPGEQRLVMPLTTLRGRLVKDNGQPGLGLVIFHPVGSPYFQVGWGGSSLPPISTGRDGTFEIRLLPGVWRISAYGEGSTARPKPVEVDTSLGGPVELVIPLEPRQSD